MSEAHKKKVTYQITETQVDHTTGEITVTNDTTTAIMDREPDHVKLYLQDLVRVKDLPKGYGNMLLIFMKHMGYNNVFAAYAPLKRHIAKTYGLSINYINKSIDFMAKENILIRVERGLYIVDPSLVGRGKWEDIKGLRMIIEYDPDSGKKAIRTERIDQLKLGF